MSKTVEIVIYTVVAKVKENEPILRGEKEHDKTILTLGPKRYEITIGPPINLTWAIETPHDIKPGQRARVVLEIET